jgi:hypothetical protein
MRDGTGLARAHDPESLSPRGAGMTERTSRRILLVGALWNRLGAGLWLGCWRQAFFPLGVPHDLAFFEARLALAVVCGIGYYSIFRDLLGDPPPAIIGGWDARRPVSDNRNMHRPAWRRPTAVGPRPTRRPPNWWRCTWPNARCRRRCLRARLPSSRPVDRNAEGCMTKGLHGADRQSTHGPSAHSGEGEGA